VSAAAVLKLVQRVARWVGWSLLALVVVAVLVPVAWVLSNLNDVTPVARPAALALPTVPQVEDADNGFFALTALNAEADRTDIAAAGQDAWRAYVRQAGPPLTERAKPNQPAVDAAALGKALPGFSGPPLVCDAQHSDCMAAWLAAPVELTEQRSKHTVQGQRCEALLVESFVFEERLPPMNSTADGIAPHILGASICSRWLLSGAVLAWNKGERGRTLSLLAQADRLHRALLDGTHSLIGQTIAWALARNGLRVVVDLSVRDAALAPLLQTLTRPWAPLAPATRRWVRHEAAFQEAAIVEMQQGCTDVALPDAPSVATDRSAGPLAAITEWLCRHRIGWHPERSRQEVYRHWADVLDALDVDLPEAMSRLRKQREARERQGVFSMLSWRNTLGKAVLAIGHSAYEDYFARQADVELHRQVAAHVLAMQVASVAPAQRETWLAARASGDGIADRLQWQEGATALSVRAYFERGNGTEPSSHRYAIRIHWPESRPKP
jgi:hypothetical protein